MLYESNNPDLRILYSLGKMDEESINPVGWAFPRNKEGSVGEYLNLGVKQVKHVNIGR